MDAPIDALMNAKAAADQVRAELVKAIRKAPKPWGPEIEALLKADDAARVGLATALQSYEAIPEVDFTKPFATPPAPAKPDPKTCKHVMPDGSSADIGSMFAFSCRLCGWIDL